jgi:hypothetical protein
VPSSSHKKSKVHSFVDLFNVWWTNCHLVFSSCACEVVFFIRAHSRGVWDECDTSWCTKVNIYVLTFSNSYTVNHCYRVLDSMAPQELCTSTMESIVEGSSIECLYFLYVYKTIHHNLNKQGMWTFKFSQWRVQDYCFPSMSTLQGKIPVKKPQLHHNMVDKDVWSVISQV